MYQTIVSQVNFCISWNKSVYNGEPHRYSATALFTNVLLDETSLVIGSTKPIALICNRTSLLDYSKLPQPISFSSLMVNSTNRQMEWPWACPLVL